MFRSLLCKLGIHSYTWKEAKKEQFRHHYWAKEKQDYSYVKVVQYGTCKNCGITCRRFMNDD